MIKFYCVPAKRARKILGKALQSKRLRGIKTEQNKKIYIVFFSEQAKKIFGSVIADLKTKMDKKTEPKYYLKVIFYFERARKIR